MITILRRSFKNSGQILVTSHNEEAIRKFSNETAIQVLLIANGWKKVVDKFKNEHVAEMGNFQKG